MIKRTPFLRFYLHVRTFYDVLGKIKAERHRRSAFVLMQNKNRDSNAVTKQPGELFWNGDRRIFQSITEEKSEML